MITEFVDPGLAVKSGLFMLGLFAAGQGRCFVGGSETALRAARCGRPGLRWAKLLMCST